MCPNTRGRVWHLADHPAIWVVPTLGFTAFLGNFMLMRFRCSTSEVRHLIFECYIIHSTVTSCVMSWHCTCTGHMTFYYKRCGSTSFWALFGSRLFSVCWAHGSSSSLAYGWCLTRVGCDASPGWSLLPSSVIIVLALVNSTVSHRRLRYLNETWECCPTS